MRPSSRALSSHPEAPRATAPARNCAELKCALVIRPELVWRQAKLQGTSAEWSGVRQPVLTKGGYTTTTGSPARPLRFSIELMALSGDGNFAFCRLGGATLPYQMNLRDVKKLRPDAFKSDAGVAEGVAVALEPLVKP